MALILDYTGVQKVAACTVLRSSGPPSLQDLILITQCCLSCLRGLFNGSSNTFPHVCTEVKKLRRCLCLDNIKVCVDCFVHPLARSGLLAHRVTREVPYCQTANSRSQRLFLSFILSTDLLSACTRFVILALKLPLVCLNHSRFLASHAAVRFLWPPKRFIIHSHSFLPVLLFRPWT